MSAVSGSQTKGEASKKYKSVNINNIFKGKSIETASKTVIPKHGMQSLGKVAAVRRIPPPANLPSLKAENCGNDPNINLVPAGGQGWGNKAEETTSGVPNSSDALGPLSETQMREIGLTQNADVANTTQIPHCPSTTASVPPAQPITDSKTNATNSSGIQSTISCTVPSTNITSNTTTDVINSRGVGKGGKVNPSLGVTAQAPIPRSGVTAGPPIPWSSGAGIRGGAPPPTQTLPLDGGPQPASSVQQSPFFHREFPTLGGGSSLTESTPQYGPGPSLRPETKGSWALGGGRGVAPAQPDDRCSSSPNTSAAFNGEIPHASRPGNMGPHGTPSLGMPLGSGGGSGMGALPSGPPSSSSNLSSASIPTYLSLMGHSAPPHQYRGPHTRGGTSMPRSQSYIPSGRPPFPGRYRGSGPHDEDSVVVPPPIIKKEDLDEFEPLPPESDAWANSALDVDYNKKLNFSEDEGSAEDDRSAWRSERAKEKREKEAEKRSAKMPESGDRNHCRERGAEEKKATEEKRDRYERTFPSSDVPSRWQPPNALPPASSQQQPLRIGYESTSRSEYSRKSASPGSAFEDDGSKRREMEEVQAALDRARVLEQEEEKRYEEKKRFDQAKRGREHSDVASDLDGCVAGGDQLGLVSGREVRGGLGSSSQDGRDANRERDGVLWDSHSDSAHDKGRDYRHYGDRRDPSFRDQYDSGRLYDRREREQQPVFSSTFKSKLPPRFQKQQQQGPPSHRGAQPSHQPPSLFDPRYNPSSYRHSGRQESSRGRRVGNEGDVGTEVPDNRTSGKSWPISGWSLDERDEQLGSQSQPYPDRLDRTEARLREEYMDKTDREGHWGNYERREFGDRERDGRTRGASDKYDYDYSRRRLGDRGWDDKKRFDGARSRDDHPELADGESKGDWRHEQRPPLMDGAEKTIGGDGWKNPKDWEKDDDHRERPQRPDSRDSRGSRESRTSKDSAGSVTQREKKLDMTSWADSTSEFDDYYRSDLKEEQQQQSRAESLLKDLTLHDAAPRSVEPQESTRGHDPAYGEMVGTQELSKENFRSGMAPAPITKERLEASENEKEVRKNMTTLRRHQEPPRRNPLRETPVSDPAAAVSTPPITATTSLPRDSPHNNLVWSNNKAKNGDRSRPDSNGTMVQTLTCTNPAPSTLNTSNSATTTITPSNTTTTPNSTNTLDPSSKNLSEANPVSTGGGSRGGAGARDKGLTVGLVKSSHSTNPLTKKGSDAIWSQHSVQEDPVISANPPQANAEGSLEEKGTVDKGQGPFGSKNQSEARTAPPQTSNTVQQHQKTPSLVKDEGVAPSKKVVDGRNPITPAQGSLSTASSAAESSTNHAEKTARDKGAKVGVQAQKGNRAAGVSRYDSSASSSTRGGRGGRSSSGSFSLYRGRGSRASDYRRGSSAARRGNPPRFQDNRNLRADDYHYLYEYTPSRKDGTLGETSRYGGAMWGRTADRRGRTHVGRTCTTPEVPSLMEADLRKQPNTRYERMPPRFLRKREQEQHGLSTKDKKNGGASIGGNLSNDKASLPLQSGRAPPKESSPEVTEDNDWETASENSDPDRQKEGKEKLGRDQKYGSARLDKKSGTGGPWQQPSAGGVAVRNGVGAGTSSTPGKESTMTAYSRCLDVQKYPKKGATLLKDVSLMGNHEQGSAMIDELFDSNSGFQEVTRKRARDKHRLQDERPNGSVSPSGHDAPFATGTSKRQDKKKKGKSSGFERSRQNKLPPRFARKRENPRNKEEDFSSSSFFKDTIVAPPPAKNAWEKPLTAALSTNSSQQASAQDITLKSNLEVAQENHDSGVEVSDPPNSTGSSQRSSPSDNPVFSRQDKGPSNVASARQDKTISSSTLGFRVDKSVLDGSSVPSQTIIFENTNFKAAGTVTVGSEYKAKFGGDLPKPQRPGRKSHSPPDIQVGTRDELDKRDKPEPIELPLNFSKADETAADMKLDFTFDHELAELNTEKTGRPSPSLTRSSLSLSSPASPSTHDLNLKIASVKKVWDTMTPLPEHPEDSVSSTFPSNFSGVDKVSGLDHPPVIESSFSSKEAVGVEESASEVGYQTGTPMQQASGMTAAAAAVAMVYTSAASLAKAEVIRPGNVCKVKPQQQTTCNNTSISPVLPGNSISPPLPSAGHSSNMYLGGNPAFGGIGGAIPSPPTVMFNSSQQLPQTGLFQPLFDGTPVMGQRGASQFSQYPYGIGQGLGSSAFGQQSMFLQTPPPPLSAPADPYTNSLSQYRLQPNPVTAFGQSQQPAPQNQSTVLISSASTTLMSSAVKPSTHTFGSSQQNFGTIGSKAGTPFQQSGLGGALQGAPQPSVYIFDPSHSIGLLNSQLVQRPGVQSSVIQTIQTPSSFYSNNGAGTPGGPPTAPPAGPTGPQQAAAGYYTASGSPLQAAVQQQPQPPLQTPPAFSLQGFGNQSGPGTVGVQNFSSGINLTAQQQIAAFRNNPANFLKSLQPGSSMPDVTRQQIKSPSSAHNSFASSYFPIASASSGAAISHCGGSNGPTIGHTTNMPNTVSGNPPNINLSSGLGSNAASGGGNSNTACGGPNSTQMSPKSQNRKMGGQPMTSSGGRSGGYHPQVQMSAGGGLRTNMVLGMRTQQLGMPGTSSVAAGVMTAPPQRYPGPGPIQRPQNAVGPGGVPSTQANRSVRGHPHQPPSSLHNASTQQQRSSNPSSAQQAKLRADALSTTQAFFGRDAGTKSDKKMDGPVSSPSSSSSSSEITVGKECSSPSAADALTSGAAPVTPQASISK